MQSSAAFLSIVYLNQMEKLEHCTKMVFKGFASNVAIVNPLERKLLNFTSLRCTE